uniref:Uncharacterized protein LOC101503282 n=1 Tax=Cicer arietinum TaxID=3827 RepID=A0A1S2Z5M8_CICAR|nr:uncharacterized protein LOC101503282 [Cicer arietinum]
MTITLDAAATLLHISPCGKFFDALVKMNTNNTAIVAHEFLGATWEEACVDVSYNKYVQYRLQWLCYLYSRFIKTNMFEWVAKTYLFHLVDNTIFTDKIYMCVEAKCDSVIIDLNRCRDYSWGTAELVVLYDNMGDEAVCDTRQLGGYITLLLRGDRGAVIEYLPRACRWNTKHVVEGGLTIYRRRLDALLLEDVVFKPYDDDRANHPFASTSMFSGYLRCGGVSVPYLLERSLQQFGHTHGLKLKKFAEVHVPDVIQHWIRESRLLHLFLAYHTMADDGLISVFVES